MQNAIEGFGVFLQHVHATGIFLIRHQNAYANSNMEIWWLYPVFLWLSYQVGYMLSN